MTRGFRKNHFTWPGLEPRIIPGLPTTESRLQWRSYQTAASCKHLKTSLPHCFGYIALYIDSIHGKLISPKHTAANVFPDLTLQVVLFLKVPDSAPRSLSHTPTAHTSCSCILIISIFYYMLKEKQCRSGMEMELGYGGEVGSERE